MSTRAAAKSFFSYLRASGEKDMRRLAPRPLSRSPVGLSDGGRVAEGLAAGLKARSGHKAKLTNCNELSLLNSHRASR